MSQTQFSPQVCLITGASRGIGNAIALELASRGHTVIGTGTTASGAEGITRALGEVAEEVVWCWISRIPSRVSR